MATILPPKTQRHTSQLFHRHRSDSLTRTRNAEQLALFQGTDAVAQNRRVALQRVVEVHNALEAQHHAETSGNGSTSRPVSPASSTSSETFALEFSNTAIPDGEVRAFRYLLRKWDPSMAPDAEFDEAIHASKLHFEEAAVKHFFRRIALWHESDEVVEAAKLSLRSRWRRKDKLDSRLTKMWAGEKDGVGEHGMDRLKEVTTREGLAQLLWTLLHDPKSPLAPELKEEFTRVLKRYYGMSC
ncbi:hypothetical protein ACN47E_008640 [Coniothyrium glycines]